MVLIKTLKVLKHILLWIIAITLYFVVNDHFLRNIIVNISVIVMVISYVFPWAEWTQKRDLQKETSFKDKNLFEWADSLDGGENYLKYLFKGTTPSNIPINLNTLYNRLLRETNFNIEELRMLRAYFKAYKERQSAPLYYKTIGTGIMGFVIFIVQAILQGRIKDQKFIELFNPVNAWGFITSIVIIALYYVLLPHRGENRLNLIINILNEGIEHLNSKSNILKEKKSKTN